MSSVLSLPKIKYSVFMMKEEYSEFEDVLEGNVEYVKNLHEKFGLKGSVYFGQNTTNEPEWYQELKKGMTEPPNKLTNLPEQ